MLKKLFAYLTLIAFFNSSCVVPALAVHPVTGLEIQESTSLRGEFVALEKRDGDQYVLDYEKLAQKPSNSLSLIIDQEEVATLMRVGANIQWIIRSNKIIQMKEKTGYGPFPAFDLLVDDQDCGTLAII